MLRWQLNCRPVARCRGLTLLTSDGPEQWTDREVDGRIHWQNGDELAATLRKSALAFEPANAHADPVESHA